MTTSPTSVVVSLRPSQPDQPALSTGSSSSQLKVHFFQLEVHFFSSRYIFFSSRYIFISSRYIFQLEVHFFKLKVCVFFQLKVHLFSSYYICFSSAYILDMVSHEISPLKPEAKIVIKINWLEAKLSNSKKCNIFWENVPIKVKFSQYTAPRSENQEPFCSFFLPDFNYRCTLYSIFALD